jgi:glycosyltransferase involved in cell wall biosynthesis
MTRQGTQGTSKRICILVQNHYDTDPRVRREAEALAARGHRVDVVAIQTDKRRHYRLNGVRVITLPVPKERSGRLQYVQEYAQFLLRATWLLAWGLRRRSYDIVQACTLPDFLVFAALVPKLRGARVVLDLHEIMPEFYMSKYGVPTSHPAIRVLRWLERISIAFADRTITINRPIEELFASRGMPLEKSTIVMNSAEDALFDPDGVQPVAREGAGFIIMYHGTITKIYGLDIALRAFARVVDKMPGAEYWIVGSGQEQQALQQLACELGIAGHVRWLGRIPWDRIPSMVAACDVGVLAMRQDTFLDLSFSNKLPEYILMGKPVIVSRLRTMDHYFSNEALAYFRPHDEADLAERMLELYQDQARRKELAAQAAKEYQAIAWPVMRDRYVSLMESL